MGIAQIAEKTAEDLALIAKYNSTFFQCNFPSEIPWTGPILLLLMLPHLEIKKSMLFAPLQWNCPKLLLRGLVNFPSSVCVLWFDCHREIAEATTRAAVGAALLGDELRKATMDSEDLSNKTRDKTLSCPSATCCGVLIFVAGQHQKDWTKF